MDYDPQEKYILPDGSVVATGCQLPTAEELALCKSEFQTYGSDFYLDKKDIETALRGDVYKRFRKQRSPWIMNQGSIGSCNSNATVNAFHNRRDLDGYAHVPLSANWLYMHINGGRDNGSQLRDGFKRSQTGVAPRQLKRDGENYLFPDTVFNTRQVPAKWLEVANQEAGTYVAYEPYLLPVDDYATFKIALASALARDHQVIHAWHVGNSGMRLNNGYAVIGRGPGNHATLFHSGKWVGGEDLVHPDSENSWGPSKNSLYGRVGGTGWGEDGFGLFTMASAYAAHEYHAYWVLVGTKVTDGLLNAK
jgi:hypothetical protein